MSKKKEMIARLESIEKRLDQLECEHDIECIKENIYSFDCYFRRDILWGIKYYEQCTKCGKRFKGVSEQEYLEQRIKKNDEAAKEKKEELKARLKQIKEQNAN